jgi:hypothetical protein
VRRLSTGGETLAPRDALKLLMAASVAACANPGDACIGSDVPLPAAIDAAVRAGCGRAAERSRCGTARAGRSASVQLPVPARRSPRIATGCRQWLRDRSTQRRGVRRM